MFGCVCVGARDIGLGWEKVGGGPKERCQRDPDLCVCGARERHMFGYRKAVNKRAQGFADKAEERRERKDNEIK